MNKNTASTVVGLYNKYLIDLLLHAKARDTSTVGGLRRALREAGHKAIDPASPAYVRRAAKIMRCGEEVRKALVEDVETLEVLTDERVLSFEPLEGIPLRIIAAACGGRDDHDARTYVYILAALAATYLEVSDPGDSSIDDAESPLVGSVISVLSRAMTPDVNDDATQLVVDGILEDDIAMLLERVASASSFAADAKRDVANANANANADANAGCRPPLEDLLKTLKNSKIADMATEISKEIDLTGTEDPMELLSFDKLTDSNSMLGSIVAKVGSKIQNKLASGELKQDELIGEAVGFLKAFEGAAGGGGSGGNPLAGLISALGGAVSGGGASAGGSGKLMADGMKMAQGLGMGGMGGAAATAARGNGRSSLLERRDRLRAKAAAKNGV